MIFNRRHGLCQWRPLLLAVCAAGPAAAQIVTDGSLGAATTLGGPNFVIGEALGTRVGSNLFHSFSDFNVNTGESATFTSGFAGVTDNVIARVTGVNASVIDGLLRSDIAGADLWLLNPNGILFGANAQLDVPAGFHASTADTLKLADGGEFNATNPGASSLTVANPAAFGFLDATVGVINIDGSTLSVADGQTLSFVGGSATLDGATLSAPSGRIDIVAIGSAGEISVPQNSGEGPQLSGFTGGGNLRVDNLSDLDVGTTGTEDGGTLSLTSDGGIQVYYGSQLSAATSSSGDAGSVLLNAPSVVIADGGTAIVDSTSAAVDAGAAGAVTIDAQNLDMHSSGFIFARTVAGDGGRITVNADNVLLRDLDTRIVADSSGRGRAGDIVIRGSGSTDGEVRTADTVTLQLDALITSNSTATGTSAGQAGSVSIDAGTVRLAMGGKISVSTVDGQGVDLQGRPVGGEITLNTNQLVIEETGFLFADTTGAGQGGTISVLAADPAQTFRLFAKEGGALKTSATGSGDAGDIILGSAQKPVDFLQIGTPNLPFEDDRGIFSESTGTGANAGSAGSITIFADRMQVDGSLLSAATVDGGITGGGAGAIDLHIGTLDLGTFGVISAATTGAGQGGTITIESLRPDSSITLEDGLITTSASGSGDAGSIVLGSSSAPIGSVWAHDFEYDAPGHEPNQFVQGFVSNSTGTGPNAGAGGTIEAHVGSILLQDGGQISADTIDGAGGSISLDVDTLELQSSAVVSVAGRGNGDAGDVTIDADDVLVANGGQISGDTQDGQGGTTTLHVNDLTVAQGGQISGSTNGSGDAGDIVISGIDGAATSVSLTTGGTVRSDSFASGLGAGAAGSITVEAESLQLHDGGAIVATTVDGNGGQIALHVGDLALDFGIVSASTTSQGDAGDISIDGVAGGAARSVTLAGIPSQIDSSSFSRATDSGDAGSISVKAQRIELAGPGGAISSTTGGGGKGGSIDLAVDDLSLLGEEARVSVGTTGSGDAGDISIGGTSGGATDTITLSGETAAIRSDASRIFGSPAQIGAAGSVTIIANDVTLTDLATISVATAGSAGGLIDLGVNNLSLDKGATVSAVTLESGNAGDIAIHGADGGQATSVVVSGTSDLASAGGAASQITSSSRSAASDAGRAGSISINAQSIEINDSGFLRADTIAGQGGQISLEATALTLAGGGQVIASTSGSGPAGDVTVHATDVLLDSASVLSVRSTGTGRAGSVNLTADTLRLDHGSRIDATATGSLAGDVALDIADIMFLRDSVISGLSADPAHDGGSFTVTNPKALVLQRSSILANSGSSTGGNINIEADAIVLDTESTVEATGQVLTAGEVLSNVLQLEAPPVVGAAAALDSRCTPQQIESRSSMVVRSTPPGAVRDPYLSSEDSSTTARPCAP